MTAPCDRNDLCGFYRSNRECTGCTYQHIWELLRNGTEELRCDNSVSATKALKILQTIDKDLFDYCINPQRGKGGRASVDKYFRGAMQEIYPELTLLDRSKTNLRIEKWSVAIKHDGHFKAKDGKEFFIEYKGYPEKGQVLGAMMAAQLIKEFYKGEKEVSFYFFCHDNVYLKEKLPGAWKLLQIGQLSSKRIIDGVYSLRTIKGFLEEIEKGETLERATDTR